MRIGIVSDTHNHLANVARIVELFNEAGVERVIHTGDITQAKTLEVFARLEMPLHGVFGNNDAGEREALEAAIDRLGFRFADPPLELAWHGRRLMVVHDPLEFEGALAPHHDVALHGHTHRLRIEREGARLTFNPGECAGHMQGLNAVGVLDLATLEPELLKF
ncbi:MAG: YfcE family phosphodiesterase [Pseudomonadales bacterium]|jgi:putative phosphoesterase|nr:YfcE family phosphodiesterase [Pseudomonadales bacterium]